MRIAGIIAEYDPFHKGHAAHIAATRTAEDAGATHVVAVISGSFTQRGEPAMLSKFLRAEMALASGADLVMELPLPWSMAPAEHFAAGGVAILHGLGCIDLLSFGSECGTIPPLQKLADLPDTSAYREALHRGLDSGLPYAAAGQAAASSLLDDATGTLLSGPNNTLGVEYIRASRRQGATWDYFTLARLGALHGDGAPKGGYASGTSLRQMIVAGDAGGTQSYLPAESYRLLSEHLATGAAPAQAQVLYNSILARLRQLSPEAIAGLPYISEGLEHRLYRAAQTATCFEDLVEAVKTKRYPQARIRRILWSVMLGLTANDTQGHPPYIRVLGMNARGKEILAAATPTLPLISRTAQIANLDENAQRIFRLECGATDLRALMLPRPQPCGTDQATKLLVK